jgi:signal transduction histidine kinase
MDSGDDRRVSQLTKALEEANSAFRNKIEELSFVSRIGESISGHTSTRELSIELLEVIAQATLSKYAVLYCPNQDGTFELEAVSELFAGTHGFPREFRTSVLPEEFRNPQGPVQVGDRRSWTGGDDWPFHPELLSWLCIPLDTRGTSRGILFLADERPNAFSTSTVRTLSIVTPQISSALANIALYDHLRTSEAKYRTFVERMQDVVYMCDKKWRIIELNPAARNVFQQGGPDACILKLFESDETAEQFRKTVERLGSVQNFEAELKRENEESISALVSAVDDGERVSVVIRDVTEGNRMVRQLMRTQKMESIGTLAAGIAHDFNNILGIILPTAELISLSKPGPKVSERAETIIEASQRAAKLTTQLLAMARDEPQEIELVQLNEIVRTTKYLLAETLDRTIELELNLDENLMTQVLINLAVNARDEMPDGGRITFRTYSKEARVVLTVQDTGGGIDPAIIDKIFDPFFTTKEKGHGPGMGLSMVYGTVQRAGGTIDVNSVPGNGTEFRMSFPASNDSVRHVDFSQSKAQGGRETILLVDDEEDILKLVETSLSGQGYSILTASNGAEALDCITPEVDLIVLDMIMPVLDGLGTLRQIRQRFPHSKVLIASGYAAPDRLDALRLLGVQGFIPKPFHLDKLDGIIRDVLDGIAA